jgi:hypothetical protein
MRNEKSALGSRLTAYGVYGIRLTAQGRRWEDEKVGRWEGERYKVKGVR